MNAKPTDSKSFNGNSSNSNYYTLPLNDLKAGKVDQKITLELFKKHGKLLRPVPKERNREDKDKIEYELNFLSVLIYPLRYKYIVEHGKIKNSGDHFIYPLCLPSLLSKDGELFGNPDLSPFIPRFYLSPLVTDSPSLTITSVSDQDAFFTNNEYIFPPSDAKDEEVFKSIKWNECWNYGEKLWQDLTGADFESYKINGYNLEHNGVIMYANLPQAGFHLLKLYDRLRRNTPSTSLLTAFCARGSEEKEKNILPLKQKTPLVNEKLITQMNPDRPLSESQNGVMDYFLDHTEDLFLTVNGPPGTGKTTLIQSIIAHIWVKAALDQTEPPIIVATSTNNNAVTNVLESFKNKNNTPNLLFKRWLPDIQSFGTYYASSTKIKDGAIKQGWLIKQPNTNIISYVDIKNPIDVENEGYLAKARAEFKTNFANMFEKKLENLSDIIAFLHERLTQTVNEIKSGCAYQKHLLNPFDKNLAQEKSTKLEKDTGFWLQKHKNFREFETKLPFYIKWGRYFPVIRKLFGKIEERHFKDFCLHELLDSNLHVFYSESIEDFIETQVKNTRKELKEVLHSLKTQEKYEKQWQEWCLKHNLNCQNVEDLSDALSDHRLRSQIFYLATHYWEAKWLQDMEKWVKRQDKTKIDPKQDWFRRAKLSPCFVSTLYMLPRFFEHDSSYLYNFIDYLIIDEAGQVNTYIAAPCLALAKKMIVVGDTKQLEPIDTIPIAVDKGNCQKFNLISTNEQYQEFVKTGFTSSSSMMNRSHNLCDFKQENMEEAGFFLTEHWRCVPEIASYCNELAYNGCLEPKRQKLTDRFYPALGYAHIPGTPGKKGGSLYNSLEAQTIGKWVKKNENRIRQYYGNKPLHEIVAILTPFKAQSDLLTGVFSKLGELFREITIGTTHSLQGAERPLIIFSPTYGESTPRHFIDRKVNFLNVTLSRAQDSFLVFGNMAQFNPSSATPSGLLARKLFAHENNEIVDIDLAMHQILGTTEAELINNTEVDFINNLESHRNVLQECIQKATKKVLIISPYISINAVNRDNLKGLISSAVNRGTKVSIITADSSLDEKMLPNTEEGRKVLKEAGANLNIHQRIHDKVICLDDHTIVIGSFNWLSASREQKHAKEERSTLCKGGTQVCQEINKHWKRIGSGT